MFKRMSKGDKTFMIIDYILVFLVIICTLYPFLYILSASFSNPDAVNRGEVWLWPVGFSLKAYKMVLADSGIWTAYGNTLWYVFVGTAIGLFLTVITAYPLSRKKFGGRNVVMFIIAFTMFFSGGLIPTFLVIRDLHMINTRWALVIPGALGAWNIILVRTFFQSIPESLSEAATIDGCNDIQILFKIVLRLSMPIIAVMILFMAVGQWNSYFGALIYLNDRKLYPLQLKLVEILVEFDTNSMLKNATEQKNVISLSIKYATIIVSTLPIVCVYPFLQKYFVKGIMIGAIKG